MIFEHWQETPDRVWRYRYFHPSEVACKGTGELLVNERALSALDALRDDLGRPIRLSSAYRSAYHNARVGGAPLSRHREGDAFDIVLDGMDKDVIRAAAELHGFTGFGMRYRTFIHIDMGRRREW